MKIDLGDTSHKFDELYATKEQLKEMCDKMQEINKIEEEIGIGLIKLVEILNANLEKDVFWVKYNDELDATANVVIGDEYNGLLYIYFYWDNGKHLTFFLKEYGKTWALTKKELEKSMPIVSGSWRDDPVTEKQADYIKEICKTLNLKNPNCKTKGEARDFINKWNDTYIDDLPKDHWSIDHGYGI